MSRRGRWSLRIGAAIPVVLALLLAPSLASGESEELPPGSSSLHIIMTGFGTGTVECRFNGTGSFGDCTNPQLDGTLVEVKATANSGFSLTALSGDGSAAGKCAGSTCSFTITEKTTVTAAFNPPLSTLSIAVAGTGSDRVECRLNGGPEKPCVSPLPTGTAVTVVAVAADSMFLGFSDGTGSAWVCSTSPCSFTLKEDSSLTAKFDSTPSIESESVSGITSTNAILEAQINPDERDIAYQFQLVADPEEYWSTFTCPPEPSDFFCRIIAPYLPWAEGALPIHFLEGETKTVSLDLEAKVPGYTLQPGTTYHYRVIGAPHIFTEDSFEWEEPVAFGPDKTFTTPGEPPQSFPLSIAKTGFGTGTVECRFNGTGSFGPCTSPQPNGALVEVKATADSGSELTALSGNGSATGNCSGSTCSFTITKSTTVTAAFNPPLSTLSITMTGTGSGEVNCRFNGTGSFGPCTSPRPSGTLVEVKAIADSGSKLTALSGNGSATGNCSGSTCSFTITKSTTVTAAFNPPLSTLSITMTGAGSGEVECRFNHDDAGPCTSPQPNGTAVEVLAGPVWKTNSHFGGFSNLTGSASVCSTEEEHNICRFTLEADSSLTANFYTTPSFESESVSGVTPTNAILEAQINPHGNSILYQFQLVADPDEYPPGFSCPTDEFPGGSSLCLSIPEVEGALPIEDFSGETKTVSLNLETDLVKPEEHTLQPGTTYHYRVIGAPHIFTEDTIEWEEPIIFGPDQTFTTPEEPTGPTNRRTLTIAKAANGPGGLGSVSSKPKGIKCGINCGSADASMYENSTVELTAKPGTHSAFGEWKGGDCEGSHSLTCPVTMDTDKSIEAVFTALPLQSEKTISPAEPLTLKKEGSGLGTVKGSGIACEAECIETVVLYQGPNPPKAAKTVTLTATPAFGSEFTGWSGSGCSGTGSCVVTMSAAKNVTATFTAKPNGTLSIEKALNSGTVTSKPKGIKCAAACISQSASMPQGEHILLTAMAAAGMTFSKWEGGDCGGITLPACTVVMDASEPIRAVFTGTPKAVSPEEELTLAKAGSGLGTVKGTGLTCEALCTAATSVYKGPAGYPAKTVTLEAASAPGSKPVQWSGCDSVTEGKCVVTMTGVKAVTATFDELE